MQVLSVQQPRATLLALGFQRLEARTWHTRYRGPLAIHAGRRRPAEELPMGWRNRLNDARRQFGLEAWPDHFPRGAVLGVVDLIDCVRAEDLQPGELSETERLFANFAPNCWVWRFGSARPLAVPALLRGQQGIFFAPLPESLLEVSHVQLA